METSAETKEEKGEIMGTSVKQEEGAAPDNEPKEVLKGKKVRSPAQMDAWKLCQIKNTETRKKNKELKLQKKEQMEPISETTLLKTQLLLAQRDAEIAQLKMNKSTKQIEDDDEYGSKSEGNVSLPAPQKRKVVKEEVQKKEKKPKKEKRRPATPPPSSSEESESEESSDDEPVPVKTSKRKPARQRQYYSREEEYPTQYDFV